MKRQLRPADRHLRRVDPVMARLVRRCGPHPLRRARGDPLLALARAIVGQMLSGRAADTIWRRLLHGLGPERRDLARAIQAAGPARLRAAGLSGAKTTALSELARRVRSGALDLGALAGQDDAAVAAALTSIHGVGQWTAQMFLIFQLGRPDVFPAADVGVLEGLRRAYGLDERPAPRAAAERALGWAPHRSAAAWYLWRAAD